MTTTQQMFSQGPASRPAPPNKKSGVLESDEKGIWLSLLDNVSRGKDLAEKQLILLGGTPEQQRDFVTTLKTQPTPSTSRRLRNRPSSSRTVPAQSNNFSLGYTYQDVLDADEDDTLARLSISMLSNPSAAFIPLLRPLLSAKTVPNTLVTILLDWADVFRWGAELRQWIRVLLKATDGVDEKVQNTMQETMDAWKAVHGGEGVFTGAPRLGASTGEAKAPKIPLGPGEWEDALGVPLCVVCLNGEKQERLEKEYGWQEGDFDFVLQWLRCILLRHGASLIYTTSSDSNNVRTLVRSSLGIHSPLKKETVKHNVIDRDRIVIPPCWDSWGKIRILREGFEMEEISNAWSVEIQDEPASEWDPSVEDATEDTPNASQSTVSTLLAILPNPSANPKSFAAATTNDAVTSIDTQTFLAQQADELEKAVHADERKGRKPAGPTRPTHASPERTESPRPAVSVNVGGVQVDAEVATRQSRQTLAELARTPKRSDSAAGWTGSPPAPESGFETPGGTKTPSDFKDYFAGLMKKAKTNSESPRGGSDAGKSSGEKR